MKRILILFFISIFFATTTLRAQEEVEDQVSPTAKGIVGCALLGGEFTLMLEGAFKVKNPWLLTLLPLLTAAGGGVGGYYLEQVSTEGSIASLIAGMALLIPTAVIVLIGISKAETEVEGYVDTTSEGEFMELEKIPETSPKEETETEVIGPSSVKETTSAEEESPFTE